MPFLSQKRQSVSKKHGKTLSPVLFFLMGLGEDILSSTYVRLVDSGCGVGAGLIAMGITFLAVFALSRILLEPKFLSVRLWFFAMGNFCGTWTVVEYFK
jgi:hypothetical protein